MKRFISLLVLSAGLLAAVACGETAKPTATPTPSATPTATATATPSITQEWNLEDIRVDGTTVTVSLYVFAGIDVWATLDDERADKIKPTIPTIEYVFLNVAPGKHTIEVKDVVGFTETSDVVVAPLVSTKEPTDGLCLPAAPLGTSVGDVWTLAGPVRISGDFPGQVPQGAAEWSATVEVTAIEDSTLSTGDRSTEPVEYQKVQAHSSLVWKDANGNVLSTEDQGISGVTVSVVNQGPVLTVDWKCHRAAWLDSWQSPDEATTVERTLSSGITAVVFSVVQAVEVPSQGIYMTVERHIGYDKLTGRLVLSEALSRGTVNGEPFDVEMVQELVSEGTTPNGNGGQGEHPDWLSALIESLEKGPVANPPASITQYEYKGQSVYYLPQRCCDIFSDLYDSNGNIIGHPDGGITGEGDGHVPDFFEERSNERVLWKDARVYDPGLVQVEAPIESVEVLIMESFPPQYSVVVVSGLPNGCTTFGGYTVARDGDTIRVTVTNWKPADEGIACTEEYRTVESNIPLGSDFESGKMYTVVVGNVTEAFVAQ